MLVMTGKVLKLLELGFRILSIFSALDKQFQPLPYRLAIRGSSFVPHPRWNSNQIIVDPGSWTQRVPA